MVTAPEKVTNGLVETESIIEEFKQRLARTLMKEKNQVLELTDREAKNILAEAYQEAANLNDKARLEAEAIINQAKVKTNQEKEAILAQAQSQAEQFINKAEENIRREAKERTKKEVESILRKTTEDSSKQAAKVLQTAQEQAEEISQQILADAENNACEITRKATELHEKAAAELADTQRKTSEAVAQALEAARQTARDQAGKEALAIVSDARIAVQKEREALLCKALSDAQQAAAVEADAILMKAKKEAEEIINQAKIKVRTQIEESSQLMKEIHQKLQHVMSAPNSADVKIVSEAQNKIAESPKPSISITDSEPRTENKAPVSIPQSKIDSKLSDDQNRTHSGKLKIDIAPPAENEQIALLEQQLLKNNGLRIIARGGAEDGSAWLEIDITGHLPLIEILRKTPSVKDVVGAKSYIIVTLKSRQMA
jgi:F0F1-type ATP synthase membrane subunit b/b'